MDFYFGDGKTVVKLNTVNESELSSTDPNKAYVLMDNKVLTMIANIEVTDKDGLNTIRKICANGDKGRYNGLTLKEDGYLNPKNAWL